MKVEEMGITGMIDWIYAAKSFRFQGQRKRRAIEAIRLRYSKCKQKDAAEYLFRKALAARTINRAEKEWAWQ